MNKYKDLLAGIEPDQRSIHNSILLIDGLNTFLRNFTMVNQFNKEGHHVGGLMGFLKSIGYGIRLINPTKVVIVFDGVGGSNSRRNLYPEYKANRNVNRVTNYRMFSSKSEEEESIRNQMNRLIEYLKCLPVSVINIDAIEADDIIGYLTLKLEKFEETKQVTIMSSDKDFLQLVTDKTQVYIPAKKKIYKPEDIFEEFKVSNANFINYKILLGDNSDNIPGVKGLGPKKLEKLFPQLQDKNLILLEDIIRFSLEKIEENKLYKAVLENKNQLEINQQLMHLGESFISAENKEIIKREFNNQYELNKSLIKQLYLNDQIETPFNIDAWVNDVFWALEHYS